MKGADWSANARAFINRVTSNGLLGALIRFKGSLILIFESRQQGIECASNNHTIANVSCTTESPSCVKHVRIKAHGPTREHDSTLKWWLLKFTHGSQRHIEWTFAH